MIILSRLNGERFALNPDLIERIDATPNTVITLGDTTKYLVVESLEEVVARMRDFRAGVLARAQELQLSHADPQLRLVPAPQEGV